MYANNSSCLNIKSKMPNYKREHINIAFHVSRFIAEAEGNLNIVSLTRDVHALFIVNNMHLRTVDGCARRMCV
jgi:hypothetical protein